jgi:nucleoid-associated protein YgaU
MKLFQYLLLAGLLSVVSCSKGTSDTSTEENQTAEYSEDEADFIVDAEGEDLIIEEEPIIAENSGNEPILLEEPIATSEPVALSEPVDSPVQLGGEEGSYSVKAGETLMMVAFNIYGDYRKWKELAMLNGIEGDRVAAGTTIRFNKPLTPFVWNPEGLPYLIKTGDSLASISQDKYGTNQKWRSIYDNNRPLIKDPNLIFAGFTLYYIPQRDLASE